MENCLNELQELSIDSLEEIFGGKMSDKSFLIGNTLMAVCFPVGIAYWIGYVVNS